MVEKEKDEERVTHGEWKTEGESKIRHIQLNECQAFNK